MYFERHSTPTTPAPAPTTRTTTTHNTQRTPESAFEQYSYQYYATSATPPSLSTCLPSLRIKKHNGYQHVHYYTARPCYITLEHQQLKIYRLGSAWTEILRLAVSTLASTNAHWRRCANPRNLYDSDPVVRASQGQGRWYRESWVSHYCHSRSSCSRRSHCAERPSLNQPPA